MGKFTELPIDTSLVLPSQERTQQMLSQLSQNLLQTRQYFEQEKDKRDKAYVDATSFTVDPSITDTVQRQKMIEDANEYQKKVQELYKTPDSGYLKLNADEQLKQRNLQNELITKQAQRMSAQAAYSAQYKEFTDPKNRGLYKPDYFKAQADRFQKGEIVTDFLETYPISTKKMVADFYKDNYKMNMQGDPKVKNLGSNMYSSTKSSWSASLLGDAEPTMENVKAAVAEDLYQKATDPNSPFQPAIAQDMKTYFQKNPDAQQEFSDPAKVKEWLVKEYGGEAIPHVYKVESSDAKAKSRGTTVNVGSGESKQKNVVYNQKQDGYMFGGKHAPPIKYSWDTTPQYSIMNSSGNIVPVQNPLQAPGAAETFKNAQINGIIKRGGVIYAAISKNKLVDEQSDNWDGTRSTKKIQSKDLDQTYYLPYDQVATLVEQEGYNLQGWDKFTEEAQYGSSYSTGGGKSGTLFPQ